MLTRRNGSWFSSVALFNSHFWLPPATGPTLMDTQLGSIKHITLQLPSFGTSALLIARFFMAMFGIGSLNLMCRLSSSVVGKTNTSFSLHSLQIISYFHWWKRHIKQLYFKTSLTFLYLLFHNRRNFELDKADCLLKDYLLWSAGSMCSSCHGFEETTSERKNTRNLKRYLYSPVQQKHGGRIIPRKI